MIKKIVKVPLYGFRIDVLEVEADSDVDEVAKFFRSVRMGGEITQEILDSIRDNDVDGAWTLCNFGIKRVVIVLLKIRSVAKRREILMHEKRHAEDDILKHCGINDAEASGYLAGYLGKFIF